MADHSNLPAPYESPWRQLGQAVHAVLASLRLDLRSLWRRNRSGELVRPSWWPQNLAPLFWPLLLALGLMLLIAAGVGLQQLVLRPEPGALVPASTESEQPAERPLSAAPGATPEAAPRTTGETVSDHTPPALPAAAARSPRAAEPSSTEPQPDPLLLSMQGSDSAALISSARVRGDGALLQLQLDGSYGSLDPRRQRRLAETWLERSLALGFEQLELIDPQGQPLGHRARVGSGMILLDPNAER